MLRGPLAILTAYSVNNPTPPPSDATARIENASKAAQWQLTTNKPNKQTSDSQLPRRPGYGVIGRPVVLWTNHFEMKISGDMILKRYSVDVAGDGGRTAPAGKKLKRIIELYLEEHLSSYKPDVVTDFKATLISKNELPSEQLSGSVQYKAEAEDEPPQNPRIYHVQLQLTGTLTVSRLMDYLTSTQASALPGAKEDIIQALNIIVGHNPKASPNIASIGANKHFDCSPAFAEGFSLGAGLSALRGYFVSVRAATSRLLVNVQVKHGAFYNEGPLDKLIQVYLLENNQSKARLAKFVQRLTVDATHIIKKNRAGTRIPRTKTIMGLATKDDGRADAHPPIVSEFGAGPKDVRFWVQKDQSSKTPSSKKGKGRVSGGPSDQGQYITVFEFFKQSKS